MALEKPAASRGDILVVDDSPDHLGFLTSVLNKQGYRVRGVTSGPMALRAVAETPPDLIILDIKIPEMNGYEVCERLKADEQSRDIPVIFVSALDEIEDKVRAFAVGGVDHVSKPFRFEEVLARVETHLALRNLQRQLEAANVELARRLEEVEKRNEELDAFAHTVAHDLKNPLSAIIGYSTMLQERRAGLPPEQVGHCLVAIERSARKMDSIIDELLTLAGVRRLEEVEVEPLDMAQIVADAQDRLVDLIEEYRAVVVVADRWPAVMGLGSWVEEVWANYLRNAIKHGGRPPHVELGVDWPGHEPVIRFWVRDNGPHLTPEEQARLFTPFERLHQIEVKGHGLGLSIVRRIVDKLGGEVGVESEPEQGNLFFFTLPAVPQA
jgi:two-component system sensor histidine kinase/response regulator